MSNFTIIRQKLIVIFIIIVFIISSLVFLNSVYNAWFVWYDNDNSENVNDKIVPVSTMFGYKILLNSYVVKGNCTNYNKDIVLTTNINTILFKIYNLIFTFFGIIIFISFIAEYAGIGKTSKIMEDSFYVHNQYIIYTGFASALILFIISNNFNNPGKKYYDKYEDDQSTFENYLYKEYYSIIDENYRNHIKKIIKNTNKNNFYEMNICKQFNHNKYQFKTALGLTDNHKKDIEICYNILELCQQLCIINKDTSVDVVKVFSDFIDNCEKSKLSEVNKTKSEGRSLTEKYIVDNLEAYVTDLKCIIGEFDFLKNNFKSILSLLWWGDGVNKNIDNNNSEVELEPIFFSSLLTKKYLKICSEGVGTTNQYGGKGKYFIELGKFTMNTDNLPNANRTFIELMEDAKRSTYMDLFLIKGILTGVIIFTLVNIVLKKYYNEYTEGQKTLLEIDKKIILSKIDDNIYDAVKYENFIKPLLKEGNYYVNIVLSIIIILLLLKVIPGYTYPVKTIRYDIINCNIENTHKKTICDPM